MPPPPAIATGWERRGLMSILRSKRSDATVEWLVLVCLIVATLGAVLVGIFLALQGKLEGIRNAL